MANTTVIDPQAGARSRAFDIRLMLAFFAIYVLWGASFLAIRIAVREVPPLFAAGIRFFVAGVVLYGFMRWKGRPKPTRTQWRSFALLAILMFVAEYAPLFWAEKYVPVRHCIRARSHPAADHHGARNVGLSPAPFPLASSGRDLAGVLRSRRATPAQRRTTVRRASLFRDSGRRHRLGTRVGAEPLAGTCRNPEL